MPTTAQLADGYRPHDTERYLPEQHGSARSDFARDRARLLHSSALRRLAAKTQVLSPTAGVDFARNRLTHSLEVAQIGRELASSLALDPDLVDTACLAHDLGHPPFGHNGEGALNDWAGDIGGFEGNAQTLRVLTRLEPKVVGPTGQSYGLNLTRASLDASCKYPWPRETGVPDPSGRRKFGVYADDTPVFAWLRQGAAGRRLCVEAQVMDLADDIAYSVHDFEDAIVGGFIAVPALVGERAALVRAVHEWRGGPFRVDDLDAAFGRLIAFPGWPTDWSGSHTDQAGLKNLTSQLIGRFARAAVAATRSAFPVTTPGRHAIDIVVPDDIQAEITVMKGLVDTLVISKYTRQPIYWEQRELLASLADTLVASDGAALEPAFAARWRSVGDDTARRRVVVDQVASLTDQSAVAWHARLVRGRGGRLRSH